MFGGKKELTVEQKELLARATELEQPIEGVPNATTVAPCALAPADKASRQLGFNAQNMRTYLAEGQREREQLATSLRNAAKAYGEIDDAAAEGLSGGGSSGPEQVVNQNQGSGQLNDTQVSSSSGMDWQGLKQAALDLQKKPDQAASLGPFADQWTNFNYTLQGSYDRFRPFQSWTGEAATTAQQSLDQQKEWLAHMAELCNSLSQQALYFADAHRVGVGNHPKYEEIVQLEQMYENFPWARDQIMKTYNEWQKRSQEVMLKYRQDADAVAVINPPKPPKALNIPDPGPQGLIPQGLMQMAGAGKDGAGSGQQMPMMGGMPGGGAGKTPDMASLTSKAMQEALSGLNDPSMSPAGLGGGGGGGGGMPSIPDMPLAPASAMSAPNIPGGAGGVPVAPAGAGLPGGAIPGAGGGAAGGMGGGMGGMPMAGMGGMGGQAGGAGKGGKGLGEDQSLYTEDRSWTEGVIGNRPRKGGPVGKDS